MDYKELKCEWINTPKMSAPRILGKRSSNGFYAKYNLPYELFPFRTLDEVCESYSIAYGVERDRITFEVMDIDRSISDIATKIDFAIYIDRNQLATLSVLMMEDGQEIPILVTKI